MIEIKKPKWLYIMSDVKKLDKAEFLSFIGALSYYIDELESDLNIELRDLKNEVNKHDR